MEAVFHFVILLIMIYQMEHKNIFVDNHHVVNTLNIQHLNSSVCPLVKHHINSIMEANVKKNAA